MNDSLFNTFNTGVDSLNLILPFLSSAFIIPVVQYIKAKIPADFPIGTSLMSGGLSYACVWGCNYVFGLGLESGAIITISSMLWNLNGLAHSTWKTKKKLTL
jgi:hypothetical protein